MAKRGPALYELIGERPIGRHSSPTPRARDVSSESRDQGSVERIERKPAGRSDAGGPAPVSSVSPPERPAIARPTPTASPVASASGGVDEAPAPLGGLLSPGHVLRLPVGYIWAAAAITLLLVFGAYFVGYSISERRAEAEYGERLAGRQPALEGQIDDPMVQNPAGFARGDGDRSASLFSGGARDPGQPGRPEGRSRTSESAGATGGAETRGEVAGGGSTGSSLNNVWFLGPGVNDPRPRGLNYLVLASRITRQAGEDLAIFVGRAGVPVVRSAPDGNGLVTVTLAEGLDRDAYGDRALVNGITARVKEVGRRFRAEGGWTSLADAWWYRLD